MSKKQKIVIAAFFVLGAIVYTVFPKDAHIDVPDSAPRVEAESRIVMDEGQPCKTVQAYLVVDGSTTINGPEKVVCSK